MPVPPSPTPEAGLVPLASLVASAVRALDALARERGVAVRLSGQGDAAVLGEAEWLAQLVEGLLAHAVETTPPGGAVGVRVTTRNGDAMLEVTGGGSAPVADDALRTAHDVAEAHGGSLAIRSGGRSGTTFFVRLPISG
jgi:signal transduction histidine kinase